MDVSTLRPRRISDLSLPLEVPFVFQGTERCLSHGTRLGDKIQRLGRQTLINAHTKLRANTPSIQRCYIAGNNLLRVVIPGCQRCQLTVLPVSGVNGVVRDKVLVDHIREENLV